MIRRSFLKILGMTAIGVAAPKLLVGEVSPAPAIEPVTNSAPKWWQYVIDDRGDYKGVSRDSLVQRQPWVREDRCRVCGALIQLAPESALVVRIETFTKGVVAPRMLNSWAGACPDKECPDYWTHAPGIRLLLTSMSPLPLNPYTSPL